MQHHGSLSLTPKQPRKCRPAKMLIRFHHLTTHQHQSAANNSVADSKIHFPNSSHSVWSLCERENYPPVSQKRSCSDLIKNGQICLFSFLFFGIISETIPSEDRIRLLAEEHSPFVSPKNRVCCAGFDHWREVLSL